MYSSEFEDITSKTPRPYQLRVAAALAERRHVLLRAPTGAGKTLAVLMPFLLDQDRIGARRMIYALPLRTLVHSIHQEAETYASVRGRTATLQTGAQPDDPFFDQGDIVVTTYDQLLSGYLLGPYSLPPILHNINAAAVAGNLVVFDEFHLMDTARAFITACHAIRTFGRATLSVWMTATATTPLCDYLKERLDPVEIDLTGDEMFDVYQGRNIHRTIRRAAAELTTADILAHPDARVLAVVNRVARAQELYREVTASGRRAVLLHSRFFARDRDRQREALYRTFDKNAKEPAIAIATQVVEAGLDLSADVLLTELCPMNSLIQRAGRCARFENQHGEIVVFPVSTFRPYCQKVLDATTEAIVDGADLDPATAARWVEGVHGAEDLQAIEASRGYATQRRDVIAQGILRTREGGISHLIREASDTVSVLISRNPAGTPPREREMISLWRTQLAKVTAGWTFDPDHPEIWKPFTDPKDIGFLAALSPEVARYTAEEGLSLGQPGDRESPLANRRERDVTYCYKRESWQEHTNRVVERAALLIESEVPADGLLDRAFGRELLGKCLQLAAEHHDLGKLQASWQRWAERYQHLLDPTYVHDTSLAHTDYDPWNPVHRAAQASAGRRPAHAGASALYAFPKLKSNGLSKRDTWAILAAILAHHGGWFQPKNPIDPLTSGGPSPDFDKRTRFNNYVVRFDDTFEDFWPVASVLSGYLRRADQKATQDFQTEASTQND
jgi:CRISPR-associated endonuclease/helicase Cas3